jgi:hypothetical protein
MGYLVYNRTFTIRFRSLELPSGCLLLLLQSPPPGEVLQGEPGHEPRTVRGTIGRSGWVICPQADGGVEVTNMLQTNMAGWFPSAVVNVINLKIPMNLHRVRGLIATLGEEERQAIVERFNGLRSQEVVGGPGRVVMNSKAGSRAVEG